MVLARSEEVSRALGHQSGARASRRLPRSLRGNSSFWPRRCPGAGGPVEALSPFPKDAECARLRRFPGKNAYPKGG